MIRKNELNKGWHNEDDLQCRKTNDQRNNEDNLRWRKTNDHRSEFKLIDWIYTTQVKTIKNNSQFLNFTVLPNIFDKTNFELHFCNSSVTFKERLLTFSTYGLQHLNNWQVAEPLTTHGFLTQVRRTIIQMTDNNLGNLTTIRWTVQYNN